MEYLLDIASLLAGAGLLWYGFLQWGKKKLMENIPTSRAGSVAMGFAEVSGEAGGDSLLKSPITYAPCLYYRYKIEKLEYSTNERRQWVVSEEGSSDNPFFLMDGTGRIMVDPAGAELLLTPDYQYKDEAAGVKYTEWKVMTGDRIYVLGSVRPGRDRASERRERLMERIRTVKKDRERLTAYDADRDGGISAEEWDRVKHDLEEEVLKEGLSETEEAGTVIAKGEGQLFVISNRSEKELARNLALKAGLGLAAGFALTMVMISSLLSRAGMLPPGISFPWRIVMGGLRIVF